MSGKDLVGQRLGGLELIRKVGEGGFGTVYEGRPDVGPRRAVKVMHDPAMVEAIRAEAEAISGLKHPSIVELIQASLSEAPPFLVMEYVDGPDLAERMPLQPSEALAVCRQLLEALAHSHRKGIAHLDLKPQNVLIGPHGPKITDFGLARALALHDPDALAQSLALESKEAVLVSGTLAYMAPEKREGKPGDARADVFSFGILLAEVLSGKRPEPGDALGDLMPTPPDWAQALFERCYCRYERRFTDAGEALEALDASLAEADGETGWSEPEEPLSLPELREYHDRVAQLEAPEALFGSLPGSFEEQLRVLRRIANDLRGRFLPSRYAGNPLAHHFAWEISTRVSQLKALAKRQLEDGSYGAASTSAQPRTAEHTLVTPRRTYRLIEHLAEGDWSDVYTGEFDEDDGRITTVCIKIAKAAPDNALLEHERRVLRLIKHKSLPLLIDGFQTDQGQAVNILRQIQGSDLDTMRERYPDGLPQEHASWVFERLLSVLGFLHVNRVIHGNIEPANVLVRPRDHSAYLIDLVFAVIDPGPADRFAGTSEAFSPPEAYDRGTPSAASDLYSLGKTMIHLLGGDVETDALPEEVAPELREFLHTFVRADADERAGDAWKAWHELRTLRSRLYGDQFRELA